MKQKIYTIDIITIFPKMIEPFYSEGIFNKAIKNNLLNIKVWDLRDFTTDRHRSVDDYQYGGGVGMVLKPEPITKAVQKIKKIRNKKNIKVILTTPQGKILNQELAQKMAKLEGMIIICGRYEGVDERVSELIVDYEISLGDYILSGGEIAALAIMESTARLVKGVLKKEEAKLNESFSGNTKIKMLDYPQYTRPSKFLGKQVPEILLSGNQAKIEKWRKEKSLELTLTKRPDLIKH